jgi:N-methylhydantoinase B
MASKIVGVKLERGMRVRLETPGGGGYGPVNERDPAAVQADLDAEYISADAARNAYGVEPNT